jgi:hypothetical protein
MIGRTAWFKRRKYGGWGLTPATKEGWIYVFGAIGLLVLLITVFPFSEQTQDIIAIVWMALLVADLLHIMGNLDKDEREVLHEAISERNALWAVIAVLIAGILYKIIEGAINEEIIIDWWMFGALFAGAIAKSVSNYYLGRNN